MSGAIEALHILEQHYEVYVLSAVSRENLFMESDKVLWLMKYEALELAKISASVSHNHLEGIWGAQAVAACIHMNKTGAK